MNRTVSNSQFWMTDEERLQCFAGRDEAFNSAFIEKDRDEIRGLTLVEVRAASIAADEVTSA